MERRFILFPLSPVLLWSRLGPPTYYYFPPLRRPVVSFPESSERGREKGVTVFRTHTLSWDVCNDQQLLGHKPM